MSQKIYDVFISYSRKDVLIVDKVCTALDREGISYFIDRQDFGENDNVPKELMDKITESKIFLLIASENSYGSDYNKNQIHHRAKPANTALARSIPTFYNHTPTSFAIYP